MARRRNRAEGEAVRLSRGMSSREKELAEAQGSCWLCGRPLGKRVEWHHPWPKSRGGRDTVPVHPICHRTIHALFSNVELARLEAEGQPLQAQPGMQRFLAWIAGKPPDFHAPTRSRR